MSLAVADLVVGVFVMPISAIYVLTGIMQLHHLLYSLIGFLGPNIKAISSSLLF